jgi:hypothetical protein
MSSEPPSEHKEDKELTSAEPGERPSFCFPIEMEIAGKVKCPLHGEDSSVTVATSAHLAFA